MSALSIKFEEQIASPLLWEDLGLIALLVLCFSVSIIERFRLWTTERVRTRDPGSWGSFGSRYGYEAPNSFTLLTSRLCNKITPSSEMGVIQSTGHVTSHRAGVEKLRLLRQTVCSDYS